MVKLVFIGQNLDRKKQSHILNGLTNLGHF